MINLSRAGRVLFGSSIAVLAAIVLFHFATPAFAQTAAVEEVGAAAGFGGASLTEIIGRVIAIVLTVLGVIFLLLVIVSGFLWMTAGGNEDKVKRAKQILINATIGLVIVLGSYAIASYIFNSLLNATGVGSGSDTSNVAIEPRSGSLGSGSLRDHFPERSATDVARNTRIMVTFSQPMNVASFIDGYSTNGTPEDVSDDTVATAINSQNVAIYPTGEEDATLTNVSVAFTDDLKTFVFDPGDYLGSATNDVSYTVSLSTNIAFATGDDAFTGIYSGGYEWSFEVGTTIDLDPPSVQSVIPSAGAAYDRNITVEITFDEAIDPTSATGTRTATSGFDIIQTAGASGAPQAGTYDISNGYRTVTFTSTDACGTNSCGETIYCLPADDAIDVTAQAATVGSDAPQASMFDGIVDTAANSLDGNDDGTAGDDYTWGFTTTGNINLEGAAIETISPEILAGDQSIDQPVVITFTDVMRTLSLTSETITLTNSEVTTGDVHEMWFLPRSTGLDATGAEVTDSSQTTAKTQVTLGHGVFLESTDGLTYLYGVMVNEGVENQYQNCYSPAEGPDENGGACAVGDMSPSCCNGTAQSATCDLFSSSQ